MDQETRQEIKSLLDLIRGPKSYKTTGDIQEFNCELLDSLEAKTEVSHPEKKLWRTLIRIEDRDFVNRFVRLKVPGWDSGTSIYLPFRELPKELFKQYLNSDLKTIRYPDRVHAKVNIGAEQIEDLRFYDWEISPK